MVLRNVLMCVVNHSAAFPTICALRFKAHCGRPLVWTLLFVQATIQDNRALLPCTDTCVVRGAVVFGSAWCRGVGCAVHLAPLVPSPTPGRGVATPGALHFTRRTTPHQAHYTTPGALHLTKRTSPHCADTGNKDPCAPGLVLCQTCSPASVLQSLDRGPCCLVPSSSPR